MEGVSTEAASIAGHLGLGQLVYFYDDNHITIDGTTSLTFTTEDKAKRFEAHGWHVQTRRGRRGRRRARGGDPGRAGRDGAAVARRSSAATSRTRAPNAIDTAKAHGAPLGEDEVRAAKEALGCDPDAHFDVPDEVYEHMDMRPAGIERGAGVAAALRALGRGVPEAARGVGRRSHAAAAAGLDRGAAGVPGRRGRGDARRGQGGDAGVQAVHADDDRRRGRPRRVDEDRVRGRRRLLRDARRAATSPSASASTRWARSSTGSR